MSHLLAAFALCAAVAVYPGGAALLFGVVCAEWGAGRPPWVCWRPPSRLGSPGEWLVALALGSVVLLPVTLTANPASSVSFGAGTSAPVGGVVMSVAGVWGLLVLTRHRQYLSVGAVLVALWTLGILLFALAMTSPDWASILGARGWGAEVGRLLLSLLAAGAGLTLRDDPRLRFPGSPLLPAARASLAALVLILAFPQLRSAPVGLLLLGWWAACTLVGALARLGLPGWLTARLDLTAKLSHL